MLQGMRKIIAGATVGLALLAGCARDISGEELGERLMQCSENSQRGPIDNDPTSEKITTDEGTFLRSIEDSLGKIIIKAQAHNNELDLTPDGGPELRVTDTSIMIRPGEQSTWGYVAMARDAETGYVDVPPSSVMCLKGADLYPTNLGDFILEAPAMVTNLSPR